MKRPLSITRYLPRLLLALSLFLAPLAASCTPGQAESAGGGPGFGIYLLENDELVLSGDNIDAFSPADGTFELNAQGAERWHSHFQKLEPKLKDSLFGQGFVIKIGDDAVCSGTIWSMLSSSSRQGIVLLDAISTGGGGQPDTVRLQAAYPWYEAVDPAISAAIADFFASR